MAEGEGREGQRPERGRRGRRATERERDARREPLDELLLLFCARRSLRKALDGARDRLGEDGRELDRQEAQDGEDVVRLVLAAADEDVEEELHELGRVALDDGADRGGVRGEGGVLGGREVLVRRVVQGVVPDDGAHRVEGIEDDSDRGEGEGREGRLEGRGEGGREEDVVGHRVGERLDEVHVVVEDWSMRREVRIGGEEEGGRERGREEGGGRRSVSLRRRGGRGERKRDALSGTCAGGVDCKRSNSLLLSRSNAPLTAALNAASPRAANCCTSLPVIHR